MLLVWAGISAASTMDSAVDGRNITSGRKSWLKNTERMYIIGPYSANEYSGWRTGQDKINRFYFTEVPDSYAATFGGESAMGVIAVAAYPEIRPCPQPSYASHWTKDKTRNEAARDMAASSAFGQPQTMESAGTGYGHEEYSLSYRVEFAFERKAVESVLMKYEWRKTLCKMHITSIAAGRMNLHTTASGKMTITPLLRHVAAE